MPLRTVFGVDNCFHGVTSFASAWLRISTSGFARFQVPVKKGDDPPARILRGRRVEFSAAEQERDHVDQKRYLVCRVVIHEGVIRLRIFLDIVVYAGGGQDALQPRGCALQRAIFGAVAG